MSVVYTGYNKLFTLSVLCLVHTAKMTDIFRFDRFITVYTCLFLESLTVHHVKTQGESTIDPPCICRPTSRTHHFFTTPCTCPPLITWTTSYYGSKRSVFLTDFSTRQLIDIFMIISRQQKK